VGVGRQRHENHPDIRRASAIATIGTRDGVRRYDALLRRGDELSEPQREQSFGVE
jgi:hypothetical protein